jgi:hypothetical protein
MDGAQTRIFLLVFVVLTLLVLVPGSTASAQATKAGTVPQKLVGSWSRNVTAADIKKAGGYASFVSQGIWSLTIKRSGEIDLYRPDGQKLESGPFTGLSKGRFRAEIGCRPFGTYRWGGVRQAAHDREGPRS